MEPAVNFIRCQQACDRERIWKAVSPLWEKCFGDSPAYIRQFCRKMPLYGAVLASDGDQTIGMALLLQPDASQRAYYGYAVCTHPAWRGQGICKKIHEKIRDICSQVHAGYFVRPAEPKLEYFYQKLGLKTLLWENTIGIAGENTVALKPLRPDAYVRLREMYFASAGLCGWNADAVDFMCRFGYQAVGFSLEGVPCGAFLLEEERLVCEVCAPEHLLMCAASCAANALVGHAAVRLPGNIHSGKCSVMGFGIEKAFYFNLYIE